MKSKIDNDEGNIGIITAEREQEKVIKGKDEIIRGLYKIFDQLEQRIAKLEKVLASHAKTIGEIREDNNDA